jgi:TrmH family RNA methyltransferase
LGTFKSNEYGLAVAKIKSPPIDTKSIKTAIALDDISDPGNLGTIIRTADWYGIDTIIANEETADFYNPKVINASMGSFTRIQVHYLDLELFFQTNRHLNVFGAVLNGDDIHNTKPDFPMVLLMGNESKGIKTSILPYVNKKITIPRIGKAESLNVAVSTAIICDNLFGN